MDARDNSTTKTIAHSTLEKECGKPIARRVISQLRKKDIKKIVDVEALLVGDVILSRDSEGRFGKDPKSPVKSFQEKVRNIPDDASQWTHAMLYVGGAHVIESQPKFLVQRKLPYVRNGTRVRSLVDYSVNHELLVCRHRGLAADHHARKEVGRWGVLEQHVAPRPYPIQRIRDIWLDSRYRDPKLINAVMCSELALELLALAGTVLVEEYNGLGSGRSPFLPAEFHTHDDFVTFPLEKRLVVKDDEEVTD